jgi:hypothetical protein
MEHRFVKGEAFGVRKLACAFEYKPNSPQRSEGGSKLPHSIAALSETRGEDAGCFFAEGYLLGILR